MTNDELNAICEEVCKALVKTMDDYLDRYKGDDRSEVSVAAATGLIVTGSVVPSKAAGIEKRVALKMTEAYLCSSDFHLDWTKNEGKH